MCDSKYPLVSRTLSILAELINAIILPSDFLFIQSFFFKSLRTVQTSLTIISITVTLMFHGSFRDLAKSKYFSIFTLSFIFTWWSDGTANSTRWQLPFFLSTLFLVFWLRIGDPFVTHNPGDFIHLILKDDSGFCV